MKLRQLFLNESGNKSELALIVAMVGILLVLFTPIPAILLDFLLITNFSFALLILLLTFYAERPLSFSTFPTLLLIATLFRLSLNVAATRLILTDGYAGEVISAIGEHVVAGNYVIGLVVFSILIVVQFVVVTSGAQRVAEVAARFTLDSMPGKQMSIDADLNMGLIDEQEARTRRRDIEREANFYGAMDGASKFVKGDAVAGIVIILINIIGGLSIGLAQHGLSWSDALHTYTLLTVGDGIVTQIPALVISTATGIIVTRAATDSQFGQELVSQITNYPRSLVMVAVGLMGMAMLPGLPLLPVSFLLIIVIVSAYFAFQQKPVAAVQQVNEKRMPTADKDENLYEQIQVEPIEIYLGNNLLDLTTGGDGDLLERIKQFRRQFAFEMGFVFPHVKVKDGISVGDDEYKILIFGSKVGGGELYLKKWLAISPVETKTTLDGIETRDPTYGLPAVWINSDQKRIAKEKGYTLVDPSTVIVTHFCELMRNNSPDLLTRVEVEQLLKRVRSTHLSLLEEIIPSAVSYSDVQKCFQNLLREKVSIRNIEMILELIADYARTIKDMDDLTEKIRSGLGRAICEALVDKTGKLNVISLDPALEQTLIGGLRNTDGRVSLLIDPGISERIIRQIVPMSEGMMKGNIRPVLLVSHAVRRHVKRILQRVVPHVSVLSVSEIPSGIGINSYAVVDLNAENKQKIR